MTTETLKASVQYEDWRGTAAADNADQADLRNWLETKGLKKPDEYVVGVKLWAGESHGKHRDPVSVSFLLASLGTYDNIPERITASRGVLDVRKVRVEMNLLEFFGLFKRFSVAFSTRGLLDGYEVRYSEE